MSYWTYVNGTITVSPMGRTQAEKTYILQTVLDHLPKVTGSEDDMDIYTIQKEGHNIYRSHNEFNEPLSKGMEIQDKYILVVNGSLRNREFEETLKEFNKWLCRLAKRVCVDSILVKISGYKKKIVINKGCDNPYREMQESPSWVDEDSTNWCEYLMWGEENE